MRTTGRRTLAGIAAGVLGAGALVLAVAPTAQAAQTTAVICSGDSTGTGIPGFGGNGGTPFDPTTVKPNCTVPAGLNTFAEFSASGTGYFSATSQVYSFTVSGTAIFVETANTPGLTVSTDGKTAVYDLGPTSAGAQFSGLGLLVSAPGVNTVSITGGPNGLIQNQTDLGTLTVTGTGASAQAIVSQGYYAVDAAQANSGVPAALAIVHVVDSTGDVLSLENASVSNLTYNSAGGALTVGTSGQTDTLYNGECIFTIGSTDYPLLNAYDPGFTAGSEIVTDACATTWGAGVEGVLDSGLWVLWNGASGAGSAPGSYTASFTLTLGAKTYPVSLTYVVSSTVAGTWDLKLDSETYRPGGKAAATISANDLGGRIVPDGIGWASLNASPSSTVPAVGRAITVTSNSPIYDPATAQLIAAGSIFNPDDSVSTYNGESVGEFLVPATPMSAFTLTARSAASQGWASVATGQTKVATARIGDPAPVTQSIAIVGSRVEGTTQVIVEGTSEGLVGKTVTPYFRFPGETGFTAGTGTRTVDAQGNFNWQRKTGKKIAVQFRGEGVVSNTVIIDAK